MYFRQTTARVRVSTACVDELVLIPPFAEPDCPSYRQRLMRYPHRDPAILPGTVLGLYCRSLQMR